MDSLRPWVEACIEDFGTERTVFGTNWPVDRLFSSYGDLVDAYRALVSNWRPARQEAMLAANTEQHFRLA